MKVIKIEKERGKKYKHTSEILYIISKPGLHMKDAYIDVCNPIFETLQEIDSR
jgi:hypothetical protein